MSQPKLLIFNDFHNLIRSDQPVERSLILTQHFKMDVIIRDNYLYLLKENLIYEAIHKKNMDDDIILIISKYINNSFNKLPKETKQELYDQKFYGSGMAYLLNNNWIKSHLPQIKGDLTNNSIKFDQYEHKIHFLNGYMDLKTKTFKKRELGVDYISKCINRDYEPSSDIQREGIMTHVRKIYPNEKDRNVMLLILGRALAGLTTIAQKLTFLIGNGSSGKSTLMKLCQVGFTCYYKEFGDDTFNESLSESKKSKVLNTFKFEPQIRFTCINEMQDKAINKSMFKLFPEGEVQTVELYKSGSDSVFHKSGLFLPCNTMPNIKWDSGSERRAEAYEHKSKFVIDSNDLHTINENKHIYEGNEFLIAYISSNNLLNAWCDILFDRSYDLLNGIQKIIYTNAFTEIKTSIVDCDNKFKDFVKLELFTDETDDSLRIHKDTMLEAYREFSKDYKVDNRQLIPKLKEYGIKYNAQYRVNGFDIKGAYYGIRFRLPTDQNETYFKEKPIQILENEEVTQLKEENNLLKQEIENLKKLLSEKSTEHITIEEESLFDGVSIDDITIEEEDITTAEDDDEPDDMKRDYDLNEFNKNILSQLL